jgi:hypothetical protein
MNYTTDENLPQILKIHKDDLDSTGFVMDMNVAGTTFIPDSVEFLSTLKSVPSSKMSLLLHREPDNIYDENAVKVFIKVEGYDKHRFIGYIPKTYSEVISYLILHKDTYRILITRPNLFGGTEGKSNIGVFFSIKVEKK